MKNLWNKSLKEECGVFGIYEHPEAAHLTYLGLYALQHRGQEGAGIVSSNGQKLFEHRGMGLVNDVFRESNLNLLQGNKSIGHVRYSTQGADPLKDIQPLVVHYPSGLLALAHNGNLTNAVALRRELEALGAIFQTTSDTEIILHLIAKSQKTTLPQKIADALSKVEGAYCLLFLTKDSLIAVRDSYGFRPLMIGELSGAAVVASESCAFDLIGATYGRDIQPGEMVVWKEGKVESSFPWVQHPPQQCVFEHIYFARPDSRIFGENVYEVRKALGRQLAFEHPIQADMVVPVPDSGVAAAIGFSEYSGIPFQMGIIRNHYVGRTFIEPEQAIRHFGVKIKLNPIRDVLKGKSVVMVDDSIVRGTTSQKIVQLLRQSGAREVHVRISAPPTIGPCFYGIDTPTQSELIASKKSTQDICQFIGADSLGYLSLEGLLQCVRKSNQYCTACFDGKYVLLPSDG
ncbi:MAG: amidophosphoribosyltransferase [Deltaproteobacteria bacterium]|nr:amidophosphoribosyltransferase [Deltaproteobacteria bacterium]